MAIEKEAFRSPSTKVSKLCYFILIFIRYVGHSISFQTFFVQPFKIVKHSWKFTMLLLYIFWDDWPIFMISASNQQLQQQLEYTLLNPDCYSWWISKMQSGHEDTLEEWYAIKFCFKLGKNATETYGMLQTAFQPSCMNRASVFEWYKRFKEGTESVRDDERCGRSKEVNTPMLIGQIFVVASHQTRLDTRSKARRPIKVGIKGRGGRERAETRTLLVCAAHRLT